MKNYTLSLCTFLTILLLVSNALAWRGRDHYWINLAAGVQNEKINTEFTNYTATLAKLGHMPDVWKRTDHQEGPRHFIDLEMYGYPHTELDPDHAGLFDRNTDSYTATEGIAPWVIIDAMDQLTTAMATTNWSDAVRIAGAMGHYAGDIHMPLHTTVNYNGQESGNEGVHGRWESEMPKRKTKPRRILKTRPIYLDNPWASITNWLTSAHELVPAILHADTVASETAGNDYASEEYYDVLWQKTQDIYCKQLDQAAHHLASLWYTAWINAGKPELPPLMQEVSENSIYHTPATKHPFERYSAIGILAVFGLAGLLIIWKSLRK